MASQVIAGLDESLESFAAAEWAAREALLRQVPLALVYVSNWPVGTVEPGDGSGRRWADQLLAEASEQLRRGHPSLHVMTRCLSGRPSRVLAAEAVEADLLVLGSCALSRVTGFALGSVGMETISAAESPVVLVPATEPVSADGDEPAEPSGDVVVGVDIRRPCDPLLDFAFDEAARRGGRLRALYAWSPPLVGREVSALVAAPGIARSLGDVLAPWQRKYPSVSVTARTSISSPAPVLVRAAADAGLVVVGRRSRRSGLGTHIGPVAHAVIRHCTAPVAVVAHI